MTTFGNRLQQLLKQNKITQKELAIKLNVERGSVSNWVTGKRRPGNEIIVNIANIFGVSTDYLLVNETDANEITNLIKIDNDKMVKIPVIGVIKAGVPILAEENTIDFEYVHQEELQVGEEYFYLQVKGDSMINANILDGSRVLIKKQNHIDCDGKIYAVRVNGDEATLKRVYKQEKGIVLQAENNAYPPTFYHASDIDIGYVGIVGMAIKVETKL